MRTLKLWHDDVRRPPDDSWFWARTNNAALDWLLNLTFEDDPYELLVSLDHDMGYGGLDEATLDRLGEQGITLKGDSEDTGMRLLEEWVLLPDAPRPDFVTIHSWNPAGARNMIAFLRQYKIPCVYQPYQLPGRADDPTYESFNAMMVKEADVDG